MNTETIKANVCASLSRADVTGSELCFISRDVMKAICNELFPRVLRLDELPEWAGAVWIERSGSDYIEPAVYRYKQDHILRFSGKDHAFGLDLTIGMYGSDWRAWTIYPSTEERKEVRWK